MCVKYIIKNEDTTVGIITEGYTFERDTNYKGFVQSSLIHGRVKDFLKSRVIQEDSQMIDYVLQQLGLKYYNVEKLIEITYGQLTDDHFWVTTDASLKFSDVNIWNNFKNPIELDESKFEF